MHAAVIACTVANSQGARTRIKDFMLDFAKKAKRQTAKEMMAIFQAFTNWFNGTRGNGSGV